MKEHRTNNFIICCIICALVVLIPLTGVVADATIRANQDVDTTIDSVGDSVINSTNNVNTGSNGDDVDGGDGKVEVSNYLIGKTLSLQKGLEMVFYFDADLLNGKSNLTLEVVKPIFGSDGTQIGEENESITDYVATEVAGKNALRFVYNGFNANEFATDVIVGLCSNGEVLASTSYSVKTYATAQLARPNCPAELRTLLVDMLNYGAAAQTYFSYNTANLANADLTAEQKAWATQEVAEIESVHTVIEGSDGIVDLGSSSLSLVNTIVAHLHFYINGCDQNDLYAVIEYTDYVNGAITKVIDGSDFTYMFNNKYSIQFGEYAAMQMGDIFTVKFFDKATDAQVGDSVTYSIHSNLANLLSGQVSEELRAIIEAMIKYGESSKAYFA